MYKYPKIPQYRQAVRDMTSAAQFVGLDEDENPIFDRAMALPVVPFYGSVKLHGTNAAIVYDGENFTYQSRSNVITPKKDNAGFARAMSEDVAARDAIKHLFDDINAQNKLVVYGEWCGGNIQKGIGISGMDKKFIVFGARIVDIPGSENSFWIDDRSIRESLGEGLQTIWDFGTYRIDIDLNDPDASLQKLHDFVAGVEENCPVAAVLNPDSENRIGEGLVWTGHFDGKTFQFKTKGEKHATSRVKRVPTPVDPVIAAAVDKFVTEIACTPSRLQQIFDAANDTINGGQPDIKNTGTFMKSFVTDVMSEEHEELALLNLTLKDISASMNRTARTWWFERV